MRSTSGEVRGGWQWTVLRRRVLKRDGYRCTRCGRSPRKVWGLRLEVHHVRPVHRGGKSVIENLRTLCRECHLAHHRVHNNRRQASPEWQAFRNELLPG